MRVEDKIMGMEMPPQLFDVCIVCALVEEARAFLQMVQLHFKSNPEERTSVRFDYPYRAAAIKNDKGEALNLHISWLSRYGPEEMTLHLSRVLEEYQPRIAIMTGICAGDAQQVRLGDLVVADRTFTYDNGKLVLDDQRRRIHLHDTLTHQPDANILTFLGLFDNWKPLLAQLNKPLSMLDQYETACHIKPMASGSAVRADNPFQDVQAPVRGAVAIDMEGAAFGSVMSRYPMTRWLIVKGVCDYADRAKNDTFHNYAACASALYALSFIRTYITTERLPRLNQSVHPQGPAPSEPFWNVPFPQKQFFTGRETLLKQLYGQLRMVRKAAIGQTISGLGGIGKTQLAVEYAYRYQHEYQAVLWAHAETTETLTTSYTEIAKLLQLPQKDAQEQKEIVQGVKDWLSRQQNWLLILDNADEPEVLIPFLPQKVGGHLIITTRAADLSHLGLGFGHALLVEKFSKKQDVRFLLHRAGLKRISPQDREFARRIADELDGLPLALNQVGAYIAATGGSLASYWEVFQQQRATLLNTQSDREYPRSVSATLALSFKRVEQRNPAAAELLQLCAFLAPDAIPEELLIKGAREFGGTLASVAESAIQLDQAFADLRAYSLITRNSQSRTLIVHRLVQAVRRDSLTIEIQQQWKQRVVVAINSAFPVSEYRTWPLCERLLPHAMIATRGIELFQITSEEAGHLLHVMAGYLFDRGRYAAAEPLYLHSLRIREQFLGPEHPDVALTLNGLGRLYYQQSRYVEAEPFYLRAVALQDPQLGPEHPDLAQTLTNLGILYQEVGKYIEAEPLYQRALRIGEQFLGPEHPDVALTLNGLANFYNRLERYAEAEPLYQRALRIREQRLGPEHPDIAITLNGLAVLYYQRGKYTEAGRLFQRALRICERQLGLAHPHVAYLTSNLAAIYRKQGRYAEAESLLLQALQICEQQLGLESHGVVYPLSELGALYREQGKYEKAEPLLQRALQICEQQLGLEHLDVAVILQELAELYRLQRKYKQAEPLFSRAISIYKQLEVENAIIQSAQEHYSALLQAMNENGE